MAQISISNLALPSKTVEIEFPGYDGFFVGVNYLTKDEIQKLRRASTTNRLNRTTRQIEEFLDDDLFNKEFVRASIKGWRGFKVKYLREIMLTSEEELSKYKDDDEVEYTNENALALVNGSDTFDTWLFTVCRDLENFTKSK